MTLPVKDRFHLPEGMIYLDGNSLGPLPRGVETAVSGMIADQWGAHLIKGWNVDEWMAQPIRVGNRLATMLGAAPDSIALGDTLSIMDQRSYGRVGIATEALTVFERFNPFFSSLNLGLELAE